MTYVFKPAHNLLLFSAVCTSHVATNFDSNIDLIRTLWNSDKVREFGL